MDREGKPVPPSWYSPKACEHWSRWWCSRGINCWDIHIEDFPVDDWHTMRPRCMAVGQHALRRGFVACLQGFIEGNANNPQHPPRKPFYYYYYFVELPGHDNQQPDNNPHGHPNLQQGQVQFPPQHPPAGDAIDDDDEVLQLPDDLY